ncbi:hypothetical protein EXV95_19105 [Acidovorax sp. JMULE5]|uniref:hypothetical protein n=1 Tax=Acidovorax sp. JMULE5 TaxID=2518343 RepID=UPI0015A29179|nr:hypothetical protein [Acidovorax sp. JMULE5]QLA82558.1 hypothetical protein EXV95_19105 [Acidovorax sp. JMULE5]
MAFKMRQEVDEWFSKVHKAKDTPFPTKFDYYYLCLMFGLAKRKPATLSAGVEFIDYFVADYKPVQNLILGLLVVAEAEVQGIDLNNRAAIKKLLGLYLSPEASVALTAQGFDRMNDYANGGFNSIVASYPEAPWVAADFLQWYTREIKVLF